MQMTLGCSCLLCKWHWGVLASYANGIGVYVWKKKVQQISSSIDKCFTFRLSSLFTIHIAICRSLFA